MKLWKRKLFGLMKCIDLFKKFTFLGGEVDERVGKLRPLLILGHTLFQYKHIREVPS